METSFFSDSLLEAAHATLEFVLDRVRPKPLDDPCIVIAVGQVVVQRGKTMTLAGFFHGGQLRLIELRAIDISPIEKGVALLDLRLPGYEGSFAGARTPMTFLPS